MFTEGSLRNKSVLQLRALATARGLTISGSVNRKNPYINAILTHQNNQSNQDEQKEDDNQQNNSNNNRRVTFQSDNQPMDVDISSHPVIQRLDGQIQSIQSLLQQFQASTQPSQQQPQQQQPQQSQPTQPVQPSQAPQQQQQQQPYVPTIFPVPPLNPNLDAATAVRTLFPGLTSNPATVPATALASAPNAYDNEQLQDLFRLVNSRTDVKNTAQIAQELNQG